MRVLQIFNRYFHIGGEELAVAQIREQLEAEHEVCEIIFDSRDWVAKRNWAERMGQAFLMAWNGQAIEEVERTIEDFKPDIILLHNLMPVGSTGLYLRLVRCGIPLIHFIHNFRPFSVNGYCWGGGRLQPAGLRKNFIPEILTGAWQESRLRTAWYAMQLWFLHATGSFSNIHGWIAISRFMRDTFVQSGIAPERIAVISHGWEPRCSEEELASSRHFPEEPCFLFLGRIAEEKGVRVLLDAWEIHKASQRPGRLVIAGDGPLAEEIGQRCEKLQQATCLPFVSGEDKLDLLRNCTALVAPSVWWEPLGLVIFEAYDFGKPVLAARSGGIVDHVEHGVSGWLHEPGDSRMLANHFNEASSSRLLCEQFGTRGRSTLLQRSRSEWLREFNTFARELLDRFPRKAELGTSTLSPSYRSTPLVIAMYLADQNPKLGRSLGISRMTQVLLKELASHEALELTGISSRSSIQLPEGSNATVMPWTTRGRFARVMTDHLHPLSYLGQRADVFYFPKGFLPRLYTMCSPSVVTIHDTIIQYYADHYPNWRTHMEYRYWASMLRHTLRHADGILTISEAAKGQIRDFMKRHGIPAKPITVTYEPCLYEEIPQPKFVAKDNYVLHLASREPHKRTAWLIRLWAEASVLRPDLPVLHVVGKVPEEVEELTATCPLIVRLPFLDDEALQSQFEKARALVFPSEIEGFGLPAVEAYFLGTPVCFTRGTSIEEVLGDASSCGGFDLQEPASLFVALNEVLNLSSEQVRNWGLTLRNKYASRVVASRMVEVFQQVSRRFANQ
ncbi:glycosyltransferase [Luteolibacter sp. Y139]|uniref:Glycosyltransferase n=2 Tax=Luteolibacter soli TaxID=3135280 RepID=A0ABU9ASY7_9BACT